MPLKETDLRKLTFTAPSEQLIDYINSYFAKRYLDKNYENVLDKVEILMEEEGFDKDYLEVLYNRWEQEQPER